MITLLKNGDIVISLEHAKKPQAFEPSLEEMLNNLPDQVLHAMVYKDKKIYHSTSATKIAGVTSNRQDHLKAKPFGGWVVFRCKDENLSKLLADVVANWDVKLTPEEIATRPKDEFNRIRMHTPFSFSSDREPDEEEHQNAYELFRAFRATERNQNKPIALPLSKSKGVSCSNFVGYALKTALILQLFPEGLPKEIINKMNLISFEKINKNSNKLQEINVDQFYEFNGLVKKAIASHPDLTAEMKTIVYNFLCVPLKGLNISDLMTTFKNFPELLQFSGYLFCHEMNENNNQVPVFYVIDHDSALNFVKMQNDDIVPLPIVFTEQEVEQLQNTGNPLPDNQPDKITETISNINNTSRFS